MKNFRKVLQPTVSWPIPNLSHMYSSFCLQSQTTITSRLIGRTISILVIEGKFNEARTHCMYNLITVFSSEGEKDEEAEEMNKPGVAKDLLPKDSRIEAAAVASALVLICTEYLRAFKMRNVTMAMKERMESEKKQVEAFQFHEMFCSFIVNAVDQSSFGLSQFVTKSKDERARALRVRLIGLLNTRSRQNCMVIL